MYVCSPIIACLGGGCVCMGNPNPDFVCLGCM